MREGQGVVLLCGPPPHAGGKGPAAPPPVPGGNGTCGGARPGSCVDGARSCLRGWGGRRAGGAGRVTAASEAAAWPVPARAWAGDQTGHMSLRASGPSPVTHTHASCTHGPSRRLRDTREDDTCATRPFFLGCGSRNVRPRWLRERVPSSAHGDGPGSSSSQARFAHLVAWGSDASVMGHKRSRNGVLSAGRGVLGREQVGVPWVTLGHGIVGESRGFRGASRGRPGRLLGRGGERHRPAGPGDGSPGRQAAPCPPEGAPWFCCSQHLRSEPRAPRPVCSPRGTTPPCTRPGVRAASQRTGTRARGWGEDTGGRRLAGWGGVWGTWGRRGRRVAEAGAAVTPPCVTSPHAACPAGQRASQTLI